MALGGRREENSLGFYFIRQGIENVKIIPGLAGSGERLARRTSYFGPLSAKSAQRTRCPLIFASSYHEAGREMPVEAPTTESGARLFH